MKLCSWFILKKIDLYN